ncbi:CAP domain-containing protein [Streptomyces polyrhachis]|uniref:CAP domain-containing protein n=1 Tax=Streptomyces polyrhachis TaxID=1282885 RepID=A0ABW2GCB1_9ACTN
MGRHRREADATGPVSVAAHQGGRNAAKGQHRRQSAARVGMLGASAAVAVGALALGGGLVTAGSDLDGGDTGSQRLRADSANSLETQSGGQEPTASPTPSAEPSTKVPTPREKPAAEVPVPKSSPTTKAPAPTAEPSTPAPAPTPTAKAPAPAKPAPQPADSTAAAEAEVLRLVNQERAQAGCRPVEASAPLAKLAGDFSADMAARDFFDHTDPDGDDPWERAEAAGVTDLGGENIAVGQANAQSVMDAWMDSDGHRANILNCEFTTLGVGVHFGGGGPWWTQSFGY